MELSINDVKHIACIWISNADKANPESTEITRRTAALYSKKKYNVAVFYSGNKSLYECTSSLLRSNY